MKTRMFWLCTVALVLAGAVWPAVAQSEEDPAAEATRKLEEMVVEVNEFVGDVRFDEADVESLIELWDELTEFGQMMEDDDDEMMKLDEALDDPEYRRWDA